MRNRSVRLTFAQIEGILGTRLPASAAKHYGWWSGNSAVWVFEGWRAIPNLRKKRVDFRRDRIAKRVLEQRLAPPRQTSKERRRTRRHKRAAGKTGTWGGVRFGLVCLIEPRRQGKRIVEEQPHLRYDNQKGLPLNQWGAGPFCRFRIPPSKPTDGVYVIAVDGKAMYVGETENLTTRYNNGYGSISPRACFKGGQSTNCRINRFILAEASQGRVIELWFTPSTDRKGLEASLIRDVRPPWNRK
jgi:hypothetical protein